MSVGNIQTGLPFTGRFSLIALRSTRIDWGSAEAIVLSNNPTDMSSGYTSVLYPTNAMYPPITIIAKIPPSASL